MCITDLHISIIGTKLLNYCTNTFITNLCHRNNSTLLGFIVRYSIFLPDCKEIFGFSRQNFTKAPNIKFHTNSSSMNRTDTHGQTDKTKLTDSYRDKAFVSENLSFCRSFFISFFGGII
jgi:hypothetical protein